MKSQAKGSKMSLWWKASALTANPTITRIEPVSRTDTAIIEQDGTSHPIDSDLEWCRMEKAQAHTALVMHYEKLRDDARGALDRAEALLAMAQNLLVASDTKRAAQR